MTKAEYIEFFIEMQKKMLAITKAKNADYTGAGGDPFANFKQIKALINIPNAVEIGFVTRMSDKLSRIGSFVENGTLQVKDESVDDTLLDLAIYSILFMGHLKAERDKAQTKEG